VFAQGAALSPGMGYRTCAGSGASFCLASKLSWGGKPRSVFHRGGVYLSAWRNAFLGGDYRLRLSRRVIFSCLTKKK
jgi:hypothetical protein